MWILLGHWDIVGHFSEGFSKRVTSALFCLACFVLCALLLSLSICSECPVSFPPETSCPFFFYYIYFISVFLFMRFNRYPPTLLRTFHRHPGPLLPLCDPPWNWLCDTWCPVITWLQITCSYHVSWFTSCPSWPPSKFLVYVCMQAYMYVFI